MRPAPRALALAMLLLLTAAPYATAQGGDEPAPPEPANLPGIRIVEDAVWEDDVAFANENVTVSENATLTIRGATVTLTNATFRVSANATLRIESLPGDPAVFTSGPVGWGMAVFGQLHVVGLPGDEVRFEGIRGSSGFSSGSTALFQGGFSVGYGRAEIEHAKFRNYSAGMIFANGAEGRLEHLDFAEGRGIAIALTEIAIPLGNSTFRGEGGQVFGSVPGAGNSFQFNNLTFTDVPVALTIRGAYAELRDVKATNSSVCLTFIGFAYGQLWDFECEDFTQAAITTQGTATSRAPAARIVAERLRIHTDNPVDGGLVLTLARSADIRNSTIGPLTGPGIYVEGIVPTLTGNTFQGVTDFNMVVVNAPDNATYVVPGTGEPGGKGWLRVIQKSAFRIVDADGNAANGMRFDVVAEDTGGRAFSNRSLEDAYVAPALEKLTIDKRGEERRPTFRVLVGNESVGATIEGFTPTNNETRVVVLAGQQPDFSTKKTPLPGAALVLAGIALLALARRRRA